MTKCIEVISGVTELTTRFDIQAQFRRFGWVESVFVPAPGKRQDDYARVRFESSEAASSAVRACEQGEVEMHGVLLGARFYTGDFLARSSPRRSRSRSTSRATFGRIKPIRVVQGRSRSVSRSKLSSTNSSSPPHRSGRSRSRGGSQSRSWRSGRSRSRSPSRNVRSESRQKSTQEVENFISKHDINDREAENLRALDSDSQERVLNGIWGPQIWNMSNAVGAFMAKLRKNADLDSRRTKSRLVLKSPEGSESDRRHRGEMGRWETQEKGKGYRFVLCKELKDKYGKDVFCHLLSNEAAKDLEPGTPVSFLLRVSDGKPQAIDTIRDRRSDPKHERCRHEHTPSRDDSSHRYDYGERDSKRSYDSSSLPPPPPPPPVPKPVSPPQRRERDTWGDSWKDRWKDSGSWRGDSSWKDDGWRDSRSWRGNDSWQDSNWRSGSWSGGQKQVDLQERKHSRSCERSGNQELPPPPAPPPGGHNGRSTSRKRSLARSGSRSTSRPPLERKQGPGSLAQRKSASRSVASLSRSCSQSSPSPSRKRGQHTPRTSVRGLVGATTLAIIDAADKALKSDKQEQQLPDDRDCRCVQVENLPDLSDRDVKPEQYLADMFNPTLEILPDFSKAEGSLAVTCAWRPSPEVMYMMLQNQRLAESSVRVLDGLNLFGSELKVKLAPKGAAASAPAKDAN